MLGVMTASLLGQACGTSSDVPAGAAGAPGGASGGTVAGSSSGASAAAGSSSSSGTSGAGAGGQSLGGSTSAQGGTAPGGSTSASGAGAGNSGTSAGGTAGGGGYGTNDDGPCAVPSFITSDAKPLGWASAGPGTTGGGSAKPVLVTTLAQFKDAVKDDTPKVIYVQGDFAPDDIDFGSNKTIIGCSSGARLQGHLAIGNDSANLIFRNLKISGYGAGDCSKDPGFDSGVGCSSGADAISVNGNAHHVWFDHCTIMDGTDGNLDITNEADFVTVSWTKFSYTPRTDAVGDDSTGAAGHRFSNLVGGSDSAPKGWPGTRPLNVTWHHNWWADGVVERQPRVRYGRNHLFNNYYSSTASNSCVRAGIEASLLLEANYFEGVTRPHEFNNDGKESSDAATAYITVGSGAKANEYVSTTGTKSTGGQGEAFTPSYAYALESASAVPAAVKAGAGTH
ncbi:MAG: cellulose-binding family [Polyangiaceae bacterium]|nr:cellulose-binding family [Polyangiaceae bacterium]